MIVEARSIRVGPYVEGRGLNSVQVEEGRKVKDVFSQEVRTILGLRPLEEISPDLSFSDFLKRAIERYPKLREVAKEEAASVTAVDELDAPLWQQWGVFKSIVWEAGGPNKLKQCFGINREELQRQVKLLATRVIAESRDVVDELVEYTQQEQAS